MIAKNQDSLYVAAETLRSLLEDLDAMRGRVCSAIAAIQKNESDVPDFGESDDWLDYRRNRNAKSGLSERGEQVMTAMIRAGLADAKIGKRMGVTSAGVGFFRREKLGIGKRERKVT